MDKEKITGPMPEHEDQDLKILAPTLFEIKKKNQFNVPKDYFENLPGIIQERCIQLPRENYFTSFFSSLFQKQIVAGCLTLLIILAGGYLYFTEWDKSRENNIMASDEYLLELDEVVLMEILTVNKSFNANSENHNSAAIDYLIDNSIDIETIINEL